MTFTIIPNHQSKYWKRCHQNIRATGNITLLYSKKTKHSVTLNKGIVGYSYSAHITILWW